MKYAFSTTLVDLQEDEMKAMVDRPHRSLKSRRERRDYKGCRECNERLYHVTICGKTKY
jgi:hypothetical protein